MDIYDCHKIIAECLVNHIDISPADRTQWTMFACALKVLGYTEDDFVKLSSCNPKDARATWRKEKNPQRYKTEETAKAMIIALARDALLPLQQFRIDRKYNPAPRRIVPPPQRQSAPPNTTSTPDYVSDKVISRCAERLSTTSLYIWLCRYFDPVAVNAVCTAYRVGGSGKYVNPSGGNAVVYPYINADGQVVDAKIMHTDPLTGSRKTAPPLRTWKNSSGEPCALPMTWALKELSRHKGMSLNRAPWCNFGDHLLTTRPDAEVVVVESEKSALILSIAYPDCLWVACGSISNLNPDRLRTYSGRLVTLCPDRDGMVAWRRRAAELAQALPDTTIRLDPTIESYPGNPTDDLADIVIRSCQGSLNATKSTTNVSQSQRQATKAWTLIMNEHTWLKQFDGLLEPVAADPVTDEILALLDAAEDKKKIKPKY